jgi:hypothetical protein
MKKFPLIILTPIPYRESKSIVKPIQEKVYKAPENKMTTVSSMNWSKSLSNFQATK